MTSDNFQPILAQTSTQKTYIIGDVASIAIARYESRDPDDEASPFILDLSVDTPMALIEYTVKISFQTIAQRDIAYLEFDQAQAEKFYYKAQAAVNQL